MTEAIEKQEKREYDEAFIARCQDLAVLGLAPVQIAERLGLLGLDRQRFLEDCSNKVHPLFQVLRTARQHGDEDLDSALVSLATGGGDVDRGAVDSIELAYRVRSQHEYDDLKMKLFGI